MDEIPWWVKDTYGSPPGGALSIRSWNVSRVLLWARKNRLPLHLQKALAENYITGKILIDYSEQMMIEDGLKRGQRELLLESIEELKGQEIERLGPKAIELEPGLFITHLPKARKSTYDDD
mmetsp:Transcript_25234/g.35237  ORF Transcript_25234/g.35237 Transcript_25234/m.35237 type:complete len:121 (-) Transcript_25234:235-597(-)